MKPGPYACQANSIIEQFPQAILILLKIKNSTDLEKKQKKTQQQKKAMISWVWWHRPLILALRRQRHMVF